MRFDTAEILTRYTDTDINSKTLTETFTVIVTILFNSTSRAGGRQTLHGAVIVRLESLQSQPEADQSPPSGWTATYFR